MKYLNLFEKWVLNFYQSINEEHSKNDPIPEIQRINKLGIILLGTPGIGKSTFVEKFILPKRNDIKVFSTDNVSLTITKSPDIYYNRASKMNINRLIKFIESERSFIYDTTGTNINNIETIFKLSKNYGYTIIFIHMIGSKEQAEVGNSSRLRQVPHDYLKMAFDKQFKNMQIYLKWKPNSYYLISRNKFGYGWWKIINNKLLKRNELGQWDNYDFDKLSSFF